MHTAHVLLDYWAECTHMVCLSETRPCPCKKKKMREGVNESNLSRPEEPQPSQKAGLGDATRKTGAAGKRTSASMLEG